MELRNTKRRIWGLAWMRWGLAGILAGMLAVGSVALVHADRRWRVGTAVLRNVDGGNVGVVHFAQRGHVVRVWARVRNLPPGFHGFHVHETGACVAPFTSAGGHLNPEGVNHPQHAGDMPVLYVEADGTGYLSFATDRLSMEDIFDDDGAAVIVHALPDNFANIPERYAEELDDATLSTGDAGARIACGTLGDGHRGAGN